MKPIKKQEAKLKEEAPKQEEKTYVAVFGKEGKEVRVKCKRGEDGKFVGLNGEFIPEWADLEF